MWEHFFHVGEYQYNHPHLGARVMSSPLADRTSDAPDSKPLGSSTPAATWAVPQQEKKRGAGLLFFAYGTNKTLHLFLEEATRAAQSFREHDPSIAIAIVSNAPNVDRHVFSHHIVPREDLLFPGVICPYGPKGCNHNKPPRQWLTRLYYMAYTPFSITWALDSNVISCRHGAAAFLSRAQRSGLWGFDIALASQGQRELYPHNWNILYRWTRATSNVIRDWLLLQLRRGVATDDQGTLHAAIQRQRAAGGLHVGQMPTRFAAAFYSAHPSTGFFPRISRRFQGTAVVVHIGAAPAAGVAWCTAFNSLAGRWRQLCQGCAGTHGERVEQGRLLAGHGWQALESDLECRRALARVVGKTFKACPFGPRTTASGSQLLLQERAAFQPAQRPPESLRITWGEPSMK